MPRLGSTILYQRDFKETKDRSAEEAWESQRKYEKMLQAEKEERRRETMWLQLGSYAILFRAVHKMSVNLTSSVDQHARQNDSVWEVSLLIHFCTDGGS